jgi:hypothetical protein
MYKGKPQKELGRRQRMCRGRGERGTYDERERDAKAKEAVRDLALLLVRVVFCIFSGGAGAVSFLFLYLFLFVYVHSVF